MLYVPSTNYLVLQEEGGSRKRIENSLAVTWSPRLLKRNGFATIVTDFTGGEQPEEDTELAEGEAGIHLRSGGQEIAGGRGSGDNDNGIRRRARSQDL